MINRTSMMDTAPVTGIPANQATSILARDPRFRARDNPEAR